LRQRIVADPALRSRERESATLSPVNRFHATRLPAATAWRFAYLIAQGGLSLTLFGILAHVLPTHAFAATAVAQGTLVIAQAVGDFGLSQAAVTALPARLREEPERTGELLRGASSSYAIAAGMAFAATLAAVLVVPAAARLPVALIAPAGAVTVLVSGADGILRAQGEFRRPAILVTVSRLGSFAGVGAAAADRTAVATCAAIAAGTVIASLPAAMVLYRTFRASTRGSARDLRRAAVPLGLAELCMIASGRLDTILLSAISGAVAGAGFESTWRVYQLAQYVAGGLASAAAPFIADASGADDSDRGLMLIRRVGSVVLAAGVALGAGLLLLGGPASRLLFGGLGPAVANALPPLAVLTPLSFMGFFAMIVLATSPTDRLWILAANAVGAVVNVVLVLLLAPARGLDGTTLACAIGLGTASLLLVARLVAMVRRLGGEPSSAIPWDESLAPPRAGRMRILVLTGRFPEAGGRGDQVRAMLNVSYLADRHAVTVLATERASTASADQSLRELAHVEVVGTGRIRRAMSALWGLAAGRPAQCGWMTPRPAWRAARRLARDADVVLVNTSRSLLGALDAPIVLDHIDAMSHNMAERARGPEPLLIRLFARVESRRMADWERRLAGIVAAQLGASRDVARLLPRHPPVHVIPNGWARPVFVEPADHRRDIDVIFTGNMDYPPNRLGADWLQREILPRVRAVRPSTTGWIVGRSAQRIAGSDVEFASDVPDLLAFLRRARVAVAPVFGAGSPSKTLEAAASGAAVVSTPWGLECYRLPGALATDTASFAAAIVALLDDEDARRKQVSEMQRALGALTPDRIGRLLEAIIAAAARTHRASNASSRSRIYPSGTGWLRSRGVTLRRALPPFATGASIAVCAGSLSVVLADASIGTRTPSIPLPAGCHHVARSHGRPRALAAPTAALDPSRTYVLALTTNCGEIDIRLDVRRAPRTTASVAYLADHGYYDGLSFDRIAPGFVIQGGEPAGIPRVGPGYTITEPPPRRTRYTFGTAAMFQPPGVRPGTSGSELFIVVAKNAHLPPVFAVLGRVVSGTATVRAISRVPARPVQDGAPLAPIVISRARVIVH
jgi:O-antigen/teichoic acid export membrane protein/cyclophilin family peptidyl-prolyl cis-trans isomerase/glycosyltransferase involved in cell wall biosynthesis